MDHDPFFSQAHRSRGLLSSTTSLHAAVVPPSGSACLSTMHIRLCAITTRLDRCFARLSRSAPRGGLLLQQRGEKGALPLDVYPL
jgi:hypothetical protein